MSRPMVETMAQHYLAAADALHHGWHGPTSPSDPARPTSREILDVLADAPAPSRLPHAPVFGALGAALAAAFADDGGPREMHLVELALEAVSGPSAGLTEALYRALDKPLTQVLPPAEARQAVGSAVTETVSALVNAAAAEVSFYAVREPIPVAASPARVRQFNKAVLALQRP